MKKLILVGVYGVFSEPYFTFYNRNLLTRKAKQKSKLTNIINKSK